MLEMLRSYLLLRRKRDGPKEFNDERIKLLAENPTAAFVFSDGSVAEGNLEGAAAELRYERGEVVKEKLIRQRGPPCSYTTETIGMTAGCDLVDDVDDDTIIFMPDSGSTVEGAARK